MTCEQCELLGFKGPCPDLLSDEAAARRYFLLDNPPKFATPELVAAMDADLLELTTEAA